MCTNRLVKLIQIEGCANGSMRLGHQLAPPAAAGPRQAPLRAVACARGEGASVRGGLAAAPHRSPRLAVRAVSLHDDLTNCDFISK